MNSCSTLNVQFRELIVEQLKQAAPTEVAVSDPEALLRRVASSAALQDFHRRCHFSEQGATEVGWRCFCLGQDDSICLIFVPGIFCRYSSEQDGESNSFVLPLLVLESSLDVIIDPDPCLPAPQASNPDTYYHLSLDQAPPSSSSSSSQQQQQGASEEPLTHLLVRLKALHFSSYLQVVYSALNRHLSVTQMDFLAGLEVCDRTLLSVDLTPLVAALCSHCKVVSPNSPEVGKQGVKLDTAVLCQLLQSVMSRLSQTCQLVTSEDEEEEVTASKCTLWRSEIDQAFQSLLREIGFIEVPGCSSYYWLKGSGIGESNNDYLESEDLAQTPSAETVMTPSSLRNSFSLQNDEEEEEEEGEGMKGFSETQPKEGAESSDEEEEGAALRPLLSPPSTSTSPTKPGSKFEWPTSPLFLHIQCSVLPHATGEVRTVSAAPSLPVCFSESQCTNAVSVEMFLHS